MTEPDSAPDTDGRAITPGDPSPESTGAAPEAGAVDIPPADGRSPGGRSPGGRSPGGRGTPGDDAGERPATSDPEEFIDTPDSLGGYGSDASGGVG